MSLLLGPLNKEKPILFKFQSLLSIGCYCSTKTCCCNGLSVIVVLVPQTLLFLSSEIQFHCNQNYCSTIIASLVILIDQFLQAFYETSKMLSIFVGLIITNCIIMGHQRHLLYHINLFLPLQMVLLRGWQAQFQLLRYS